MLLHARNPAERWACVSKALQRTPHHTQTQIPELPNPATHMYDPNYVDDDGDSVTAAVSVLDAALDTNGEAAFFAMSGVTNMQTGSMYLFVQRGDDDLVVQVDNIANTFSGVSAIGMVATNGNTENTLVIS